MKAKIVSATTLTIAAISLALVGASPAVAKHKHHCKAKAEKSGCASKNGCNAAMKGDKGKAETGKADEKMPADKGEKK
jgi:hypothetical protein